MDAQNNAGKQLSLGQLLSDADIQRAYETFDFAAHWTRSGFVESSAFDAVVKAITKGDSSLTDQILRLWRVR